MKRARVKRRTGATHVLHLLSLEPVEVRAKDESGRALAGWHYLLTAPDGTRRRGQLDQEGYARIERVLSGACTLRITQDALPDGPPPPPPPSPPPPASRREPGAGKAARRRRGESARDQPGQR